MKPGHSFEAVVVKSSSNYFLISLIIMDLKTYQDKYESCEKAIHEVQNALSNYLQEISFLRKSLQQRHSVLDVQFFKQRLEFVTCVLQATKLDLEANSYATILQYRALIASENSFNIQEWRKSIQQSNESLDFCTRGIQNVQRVAIMSMSASATSQDGEAAEQREAPTKDIEVKNEVTSTVVVAKPKEQTTPKKEFKSSLVFSEGSVISATITFIMDKQELVFYACPTHCKELVNLDKEKNLTQFWRLPSEGDIFGVAMEENVVLRAICKDNNANPVLVNLIDIGKVIKLNDKFKLLRLPSEYTAIPPQAIKCQIYFAQNESDVHSMQKNYLIAMLQKCEGQDVLLRIKRKSPKMFLVDMLADDKQIAEVEKEFVQETENIVQPKGNPFCLDDESEHDEMEQMNLKNLVIEKKTTSESQTLTVLVTHIRDAVCFYAQIKDEKPCAVYWSNESVNDTRKLSAFPEVGDFLLARYAVDALWYRAEVREVKKDEHLIKVFFVDFGNEENVPLSGLATLLPEQLNQSFRAQLFRLANMEEYAPQDEKKHCQILDAMRVLLLNSEIKLKIRQISFNEEVVVDLIDKSIVGDIDDLVQEKLLRKTV